MPAHTLERLATGLKVGKFSSRGLVETALAAIADPAGEGARTFVAVDAAGARAAADHMDALRKAGRAPSLFAGIPFSVKDLFDLAGEVTTAGSKVLANNAPAREDATAIARLKSAGLVVIGRSNMTEFAYSGVGLNPHYGTPRSPYDRATGRIPGGSSSGAAVSVADDMVSLAIGTDTGGSCRIPASYCGIVGHKPSHSRVPLKGAYPLSFSFDSIGPLANSVRCCAAADAIMAADWDGIVPERNLAGLRLAVLSDFVLDGLDTDVTAAFDAVLKRVQAMGAVIADMAFPELHQLPTINGKGGIVAAEALHHHRARIAASGDAYDPRVRNRIQFAEAISAADYLDYFELRREMIGLFAERFAGFDAVLMPTTAITPPAIADLEGDKDYLRLNGLSLRNTYVGNFLNGCAISIPMHRHGTPPCGLMALAPWGHDRALFGVAAALESAIAGLRDS
jgi:aspartyl-tRNA(Asn)/glutamyl-tRNA(Gln) amidotransferase subunit A